MTYLTAYLILAVLTFLWALRNAKRSDLAHAQVIAHYNLEHAQKYYDNERSKRIVAALLYGVLAPASTLILIYNLL